MNTSKSRIVARTSVDAVRRFILTGALMPAALILPAHSADVLLPPDYTINTDTGTPTFADGLREGLIMANNDFTTANPLNGPNTGQGPAVSLGLRMGNSGAFGPDGWGDNRTWVYTGQVFTGPNGIISFAANNDDSDWISIDGVVRLNNTVWNEANATVTTGLTPNTWVPFEYRVANGGGGAGPSGQNTNGTGWSTSIGVVFSWEDEAFSTTATNYDQGIAVEPAGGGQTVFRYQNGFGFFDDLVVQNTAAITINGQNVTVSEPSLRFTNTAASTLTVNDGAGTPHKTLSISGLTQWATATSNGANVTLDGSTDLRPAGPQTDNGFSVVVTKNGTGRLILDTLNPGSNLVSTTFAAGTGVVEVISSTGSTPVPGATLAITDPAGILRIGSASNAPATFLNPIRAVASGKLQHTSLANDTLAGSIVILGNQNLTFDVTAGRLFSTGGILANQPNAGITKTGNALMRVTGPVATKNLTVNAGRLEVGPLALTNNPVLNGGVLALTNTLGSNTLPNPLIVTGAGALEGRAGSFGLPSNAMQITGGGTLRIGGDIGLSGFFYGGDDGGAHNAFGGPDLPNNTYNTYTTYFAGRGGLEATALTSAGDVVELSYDPAGGDTSMYSMYGQNRINNIVSRMVGKIYIEQPGLYTFNTRSDDGSMLFINGVPVVSNNVYQGMTTRTGTVNLGTGFHDIDIGFYEGGGGNGLVVSWAGPGINGTQNLTNSVLYPNLNPEVIPNPVSVSGVGNIHTIASVGRIGDILTLAGGGTLNTTGNRLSVDEIVLPVSGGTYTFGAQNETTLSQIIDNGAPVAIVKTGTGVLVIDNVGGPHLQNVGTTISVNQGALGILLGALTSPTGNAVISFNGGGVVLSSKGGNQSYTIPTFNGNGSIEARQLATGVAGTPAEPIIITLQGNLNVPAGTTFNLGTRDNYVEEISGAATGSGTVGIRSGTVTSKSNTAVQGLRVSFNGANAVLNMLTNAPVVGALDNEPGVNATTIIGDGVGGDAVLTVNSALSGEYTGTMLPATNNVLHVVKNGSGSQYFGGPTQAASFTLNEGTLELSSTALGNQTAPINIGGPTNPVLQFANPGLDLRIYDSDPGAALAGGTIPGAYTAILTTIGGVNARYGAMGTPSISTSTAANGNQFINYNPGGGDQAPFAIHGQTDVDTIEAIFRGEINITTPGTWTFDPRSDDGTMVYIDDILVSNNNFPQGIGHVPRPGSINLTEGRHSIVITFNEGAGGAGMFVNVTPPGGGSTLLSNNILFNREFSAPNPVNITGPGTINAKGGSVALGNADQATGATLTVGGGGIVSFPKSTPVGGTTLNYLVNANTTLRPGELSSVSTLNASGAGTVLLDFPGAQLPTGTINVTGGTVAAATSPNGLNPLGGAAVALSGGGSLGLTITAIGADTTFTTPITLGTGGGFIQTGRFSAGPAAAQTITYGAPLTVANSQPLGFGARDGYTLVLSQAVSSNGPLSSISGEVQAVSALSGTTLAVTGGRLDTQGALTFSGGATISSGATLRLNSNAYTGGPINVSGTLDFNGSSNGNIQTTYNGGTLRATAGVVDLGTSAVAGTVPVVTPNAGVLAAKSYSFTGPTGGFGSDQGIAFTLAATPALSTNLAARDLNFGPIYAADPVYNAFFGAPTGDAFTASFTGKFTAPSTGPFTFGQSILDDNASIWIDLNQNGIFEQAGSAGSERLTQGGCCGPDPATNTMNGVANLVQGQKYGMVFIVEDTGGGSSYAARWDAGNIAGPGGLSKFVNPGDPAQAGIWSTESTAGGAKLEIAAGAEVRAAGLTNVTDAYLMGNDAKLTITGSPGGPSNVGVLRNSTGTSIVDIAAGNTVTVDHFAITPGSTVRKLGAGTVVSPGTSIGAGGFLLIESGTVVHTAQTVAGAAGGNTGTVSVSGAGVFDLQGTLSGAVQLNGGGLLKGTGSVGALTADVSSVIVPGAAPGTIGTLSTTGLSMLAGSTFGADIISPLATDHFNVAGTVFLADATLSLASGVGFNPQPNELFPLIINDLDDLVSGTFLNLAQGATVVVNGYPFQLSYAANLDGGSVPNDVALIAIPEPGSVALLLGGFGMLIGAQRMRRRGRA